MGKKAGSAPADIVPKRPPELVVITGLSGSGKATVLKCLEDIGFYSVDNLPTGLISKFAELTKSSPAIQCAALVTSRREFHAVFAYAWSWTDSPARHVGAAGTMVTSRMYAASANPE